MLAIIRYTYKTDFRSDKSQDIFSYDEAELCRSNVRMSTVKTDGSFFIYQDRVLLLHEFNIYLILIIYYLISIVSRLANLAFSSRFVLQPDISAE